MQVNATTHLAVGESCPTLFIRGLRVPARTPDARAPLAGPIDLTLKAGQCLGVVGPSGCGKSTLLRAIAMLEPCAEGQLLFHGRKPRGAAVPAYRRRVVLLSQSPARLPGSVLDNLRAPFALRSARGQAFDEPRAARLCRDLDLDSAVLSRPAAVLSGGEAQRMALARALLVEPEVLLLDEFSGGLDPESRDAAERTLRRFRAENPKRALMLVSHDASQHERLTDSVLGLDRHGRMAQGQDTPCKPPR